MDKTVETLRELLAQNAPPFPEGTVVRFVADLPDYKDSQRGTKPYNYAAIRTPGRRWYFSGLLSGVRSATDEDFIRDVLGREDVRDVEVATCWESVK